MYISWCFLPAYIRQWRCLFPLRYRALLHPSQRSSSWEWGEWWRSSNHRRPPRAAAPVCPAASCIHHLMWNKLMHTSELYKTHTQLYMMTYRGILNKQSQYLLFARRPEQIRYHISSVSCCLSAKSKWVLKGAILCHADIYQHTVLFPHWAATGLWLKMTKIAVTLNCNNLRPGSLLTSFWNSEPDSFRH